MKRPRELAGTCAAHDLVRIVFPMMAFTTVFLRLLEPWRKKDAAEGNAATSTSD